MTKITTPVPIVEFGSTHVRLAIYDKFILNQNLSYEKKIDFTKNNIDLDDHPIFDLIINAEKDIDQHLNEILLVLDSSSIYSLDFSIKKNYENKKITNNELNYLIRECENIIKLYNKDKDILHIFPSKIICDDVEIYDAKNISRKVYNAIIELKFIMINKNNINIIRTLLLKKHISLKEIYCASYIKSLGLINKLEITGYSSFIDIGLKKSSLLIFDDKKLLYLNTIHIGGDSITKDISKVLNFDYRKAEAEKLKFSKTNKLESETEDNKLLRKIINSRLEEIIELLFLNCPLVKKNFFDNNLKLFFTGNGSKVLNKNLLSFGSELNFINDMSIIEENSKDCCDAAIKFNKSTEKTQLKKDKIGFENVGFFEKLFEYFSNK